MWNRKFLILCVIWFGMGVVTAPIEPLFAIYFEDHLGKAVLLAAILQAIQIGLGGIFAIIGGRLSDQLGRKVIVLIGMTGALAIGGVFVSTSVFIILLILCYRGVASGFRTSGGQSYLIDAVPREKLGSATAIYFLSGISGQAIGNVLSGVLIERHGYSFVGVRMIAIMFVLILLSVNFLPSDRRTIKPTIDTDRSRPNREISFLIAIRFLTTLSWGVVSLLLPVMIFRLTSVKITGYFNSVSLLFACCCLWMTGVICDRIGERLPVLIIHSLIILSLIVTVISVGSAKFLFVAGTLATGAAWSMSTTIPRLIDQYAAERSKGFVVGVVHFAWSFGFLSGKLIGGGLERISYQLPFLVAIIAIVISFITFVKLKTIPKSI